MEAAKTTNVLPDTFERAEAGVQHFVSSNKIMPTNAAVTNGKTLNALTAMIAIIMAEAT